MAGIIDESLLPRRSPVTLTAFSSLRCWLAGDCLYVCSRYYLPSARTRLCPHRLGAGAGSSSARDAAQRDDGWGRAGDGLPRRGRRAAVEGFLRRSPRRPGTYPALACVSPRWRSAASAWPRCARPASSRAGSGRVDDAAARRPGTGRPGGKTIQAPSEVQPRGVRRNAPVVQRPSPRAVGTRARRCPHGLTGDGPAARRRLRRSRPGCNSWPAIGPPVPARRAEERDGRVVRLRVASQRRFRQPARRLRRELRPSRLVADTRLPSRSLPVGRRSPARPMSRGRVRPRGENTPLWRTTAQSITGRPETAKRAPGSVVVAHTVGETGQ